MIEPPDLDGEDGEASARGSGSPHTSGGPGASGSSRSNRGSFRLARDGWIVLGVAIVVRCIAWFQASDAPFGRVLVVDESAYVELARGILAGTPPPHGAWYVAPGYAYVLALIFVAGGGVVAAKIVNLLAGAATAWLVWSLARRLGGRGMAVTAGIAWAVYPAALLQEILVLKSALAVFFLLAALAAILGPARATAGTRRWFLAGIGFGIATLLRAEMLVLALTMALAAWIAAWRRWPGAPSRWAPALFLAAVAACVAVPTLQNRSRSGDWVLVAFGGGPNFYIGNHSGADGGYVPLRPDRFDPAQEETDAALLASGALRHVASPAEVASYWYGRGLEWWRREPLQAVALTAKKWAMLWGPWELADVLSTTLAGRWVWVLRNPLVGPALFLPAALAGLWITRRRRELWPLQAFLVGAQLAILPFFLFERFRLHLVAASLPFAAAAAEHAWKLVRARRWRRLALGAAATALAVAGLATVRAPRDPIVLRVNLGEMLFQDGQYVAALEEFEAVRAGSPGAWRVDVNIANAEAALGHDDAALAALARLLPRLHAEGARTGLPSAEELTYAHELAGDLEYDRGRLDAAAAHYREALRFASPASQPPLRAKLAACSATQPPRDP